MLRSGAEIPLNCKDCFEWSQVISELATSQAAFVDKTTQYIHQEKGATYTGNLSEIRQSDEGRIYTETEERTLDILELTTFCSGNKTSCFKANLNQ